MMASQSDPTQRPGGPLGSAPGIPPTVRRLEGASVTAAWGAPDLFAGFSARRSPRLDTGPLAEIWFGAHPSHPSAIAVNGGRQGADSLPDVERPTLLVKLIAVGGPLSVQVHPDDVTAQDGFIQDELTGLAIDAPGRRYRDPFGKPELLHALGPMHVLCGFRRAAVARALLSDLVPSGADELLEALALGDAALGDAVTFLLHADHATIGRMLEAVVASARDIVARALADGMRRDTADALVRLAWLALDLTSQFPGDRGPLVALLLEEVELAPGETIYVAPGTPHAYLSGLGVEVMTSSDNVLRCGMTVKPVDVDAFLSVLDATAVGVPRVGALPRNPDGSGWRRTVTPTDAFVVDAADIDGPLRVERTGEGASILLCTAGDVTVRAGDGSGAELRPGGAVLLSPGLDRVEVRGTGQVLHAGPGRAITLARADLTSV
jgi:mannose-6-phosphate isomerase